MWGAVRGYGAQCGAMGRCGAQCGAMGRCAVLTEVAAAVCEPQPEGDESQQRQQHHHRRHNAAHVELTWGAVIPGGSPNRRGVALMAKGVKGTPFPPGGVPRTH